MPRPSEDNVIYANFGARKRVSSPQETGGPVGDVATRSPAARRLIEDVYSRAEPGRIARGKQYAYSGMVLGLDVRKAAVHGRVAGSQNEPFAVLLQFPYRSNEHIAQLSRMLARTSGALAAARRGDLSSELLDLLLVAEGEHISGSCTCPDSAPVCKHIVAVVQRLAGRIDADPQVVFMLRGFDFAQLEAAVMAQAEKASRDSYANADLSVEERNALFWDGRDLPELPVPKTAPALNDSDPDLLRKAMRTVSHTNIDLLRAISDIEDLYHELTH